LTATASTGDGPDVLAYDKQNRHLYVAAERRCGLFAVGADGSLSKVGMGTLAQDAHSVVVDPTSGYAYFPIRAAGGAPVLSVFKPGDVE
jgi:hypothetical protein